MIVFLVWQTNSSQAQGGFLNKDFSVEPKAPAFVSIRRSGAEVKHGGNSSENSGGGNAKSNSQSSRFSGGQNAEIE